MKEKYLIKSTDNAREIALRAIEGMKMHVSRPVHARLFCVGRDKLEEAYKAINAELKWPSKGLQTETFCLYDKEKGIDNHTGHKIVDVYEIAITRFSEWHISIATRYCGIEYKDTIMGFYHSDTGVIYYDWMRKPHDFTKTPQRTDGITEEGLEKWHKFYREHGDEID